MERVSLFAAFLAGIISFISPCVLPLIPAYISFISGLSLESMVKEGADKKYVMKKVAVSSILFIIGFSVVFIGLGASATSIGKFLLSRLSLLEKMAGIVLIVFGLHIAGVFKIRFMNYEKRVRFSNRPAGLLGPFVIGLAFAFGWTPCIGPVLGAILIYSSSQETVSQGILLLSMYSLGIGIPFFLTGLSINAFLGFLKSIKKYYKVIEIVIGSGLIIMGILTLADLLTIIANIIIRWFPWLSVG